MIKALSGVYGKEKCVEIFRELKIDENTRAEKLSPNEFLELNSLLNS